MSVVNTIAAIPATMRPAVVSIGNFDGVHLGHQSVIKQLLEKARLLNLPAVVVTFDPLAKEYFAARRSSGEMPARLTSAQQRAELLLEYGVDHVVCLPFDDDLAQQSAHDFVYELLLNALQTRYLVVGDDFHFGHNREGDFGLLQQIGEREGFSVASMQTFRVDEQRVSSGRVRLALSGNDFALAERLLGRSYAVSGTVVQGNQLGQTIGFPTANIALPDFRLPIQGVFAVQASLNGGEKLNGVANIGRRPTVDGKENRLEVHLFDLSLETIYQARHLARQQTLPKQDSDTAADNARQWHESEASYDLYGLKLEVFFIHRIRDEMKFSGVDELQAQIQQDVSVAQSFFTTLPA